MVLLSASLAGLSRGAYPLSSLQHPDSPSLHLPHLLRGAHPLRAHNKRSPPQNLLPGERERYTSLQPRSASSRSALRHASYTPHVRLMYASCTLRAHRKDRPRNMTTSGERGRYITRLREKARQERSCSLPLISPKTHRVPFALTKSTLLGTGAILVSAKGTRGKCGGDARARQLCLAAVGRGWQRFAVLIDA